MANDIVYAIYGEPDGVMWFGTLGGVSRYDGKEFASFTTEDGLVNNRVISIYVAQEGLLWFGTRGGGVACYDGTVWTSLDTRDGLANNAVIEILQDRQGDIWFGTWGGLTRFRAPEPSPPPVFVDAVVADRRYEGISEKQAKKLGIKLPEIWPPYASNTSSTGP